MEQNLSLATRRSIYIRREGANGKSKQNKIKTAEKPWFFNLKSKRDMKMLKRRHTAKQYTSFLFAVMPKCDSPFQNRSVAEP
ncbi:MAG: hypothetical protein J6V82_03330, partial [Clostridia bacterium]|nr:hypothetical protein [Clostridia bacterium]